MEGGQHILLALAFSTGHVVAKKKPAHAGFSSHYPRNGRT
jgi:hypothetical protein